MKELSICMIGFGNVGKAFARLLLQKSSQLKKKYGFDFKVTAIATGSHGKAIDHAGIDLNNALTSLSAGTNLDQFSTTPAPTDPEKFIKASKADILVETSPVNYETGQPAILHIRTGLENGMHCVTANKGPVVHAFESLTDLGKKNGKHFLFESTVMDGAPIFSVFREALPCTDIDGFEGILNSSTNLLIEQMEDGKSFNDAVAYAQSIGIAETDPSGDIDGWDAAIKVASLVSVLMGTPIKPQDVDRTGIRGITKEKIEAAKDDGKRWKLVCTAQKDGSEVNAKVAPQMVSPDSPLYSVSGTSSLVIFKTDILPGLGILESNPSPETTAYGLLADILNILKQE